MKTALYIFYVFRLHKSILICILAVETNNQLGLIGNKSSQ